MIWWLTQHTLTVAALTAVAWLVCRRRRVGPAIEHALWLVVLVKLLAPPLVTWPWPAPAWLGPAWLGDERWIDEARWIGEQSEASKPVPLAIVVPRPAPSVTRIPLEADAPKSPEPLARSELANSGKMSAENGASGHASANEVGKGTGFRMLHEVSRGPAPGSVREADDTPAPATAWSFTAVRLPRWLGPVLLAIWLSGSAVIARRQWRGIRRARRLGERAQEAPGQLVAEVARLATLLRIVPPRVYVLPGIASPFVWCLGRPTLWWPASLLGDGAAGRWRGVVLHELAHLRRRDHWVAWLDLAAGCVWWFNPLAWYVRRRLRESAELACDAWVVATLPDERRSYAEALFEVAQVVSQIAAPLPAVGISAGTHRGFQRRLTMILQDRVRCRVSLRALFLICLWSLAALPGWSQEETKKEARPAERSANDVGSSKTRDHEGVVRAQQKSKTSDEDQRTEDEGKPDAKPGTPVRTQNAAAPLMPPPAKVLCLTVTPDGQAVTFGGASDDGKGLFNIWVEKPNAVLGGAYRPSPVTAIAYSPDGNDLACGQADGNVAVWHHSPTKGNVLLNWNLGMAHAQNNGAGTTALAFTPDGKLLAALGPDRAVHLWDPEPQAEVRVLSQDAPVQTFAISPDGKLLATGGSGKGQGTVTMFDIQQGKIVASMVGHTAIAGVVFSPDGETLTTSGRDGTACLWKVPEGTQLARLELASPIVSLVVSPRGGVLATGGDDGSVTVWQITPRGPLTQLLKLEAKDIAAPLAAFDSRGRLVVISNDQKRTPRLIGLAEPPEPAAAIRNVPATPARPTLGTTTVAGYQLNKTKARASAAEDVQTLSRAKYPLPAAKAAALEAFLRDHVSAEVETKIVGETITITTDPETQEIIGRFIALMRKE